MYYTGFADEAGADFDVQIKATKELGWDYIETRALYGKNLAFIDDETFEMVCQKLDDAGLKINCFGSGVGNWATKMEEAPDGSYEELRLAIPRMKKLGIKMIRVMSFPVPLEQAEDYAQEAFKRMRVLSEMCADAGIICAHENCSGWGGLSFEHTLRMIEAVNMPSLKLIFDTGNPVVEPDVRGEPPYKMQDAWEFYKAVKDHIVYVHIKDAVIENGEKRFTFAGEGDGYVREIVKDVIANGYDGGFSMEPHMKVVAHDKSVQSDADLRYSNYIEYGQRFEKLVDEVKAEINS